VLGLLQGSGARAGAVDRSVRVSQPHPQRLADLCVGGHDRVTSDFQLARPASGDLPRFPASGPECAASRADTGRRSQLQF